MKRKEVMKIAVLTKSSADNPKDWRCHSIKRHCF
jgi:hypothetical protein